MRKRVLTDRVPRTGRVAVVSRARYHDDVDRLFVCVPVQQLAHLNEQRRERVLLDNRQCAKQQSRSNAGYVFVDRAERPDCFRRRIVSLCFHGHITLRWSSCPARVPAARRCCRVTVILN